MPDWTKTMQQTFEYYIVNPHTWQNEKKLNNVKSCTINRDAGADTLGSATIDIEDEIGECYIRVYLVTVQNGVMERHPLGTFMVQTPAIQYNGKSKIISLDTYTPLIELSEKKPPIGYYIAKETNIMQQAYMIMRENMRAPVVKADCDVDLYNDFVSQTEDSWLTFCNDLVSNAKYELDMDEMGRVLFSPRQEIAALQPIHTFNDDNSSILYPELTVDRDLYGIPNVVEVLCSTNWGPYYARAVNEDPNSPTSTVSRGREIIYRETSPKIIGNPTQGKVYEYANQLLQSLSSLEYKITYTHGYCPVRLNDCVRLNYKRSGINNVKAKVISQKIKCVPGCPVTEKAIYTVKLWR